MGGCCCASRQVEVNSSRSLCRRPRALEEREPLPPHLCTSYALSGSLLVDTNLDTSFPDTYRPPPAPLPYDQKNETTGQTTNGEVVVEGTNGDETIEKTMKETVTDCKVESNIKALEPKEEVEDEKSGQIEKKGDESIVSVMEEEDTCPTCFEEYDAENPKIMTKCEHHFHLACILEWMERSNTCPVCDQDMIFNVNIDD